jgi:hypothetical protein
MNPQRRWKVAALALGIIWLRPNASVASGEPSGPLPVMQRGVQQISRDTIHGIGLSEDDTEVEPDVAVDPFNPSVVVATLAQGRNPDGASSALGFATSHDGGLSWTAGTLPGLMTAQGGPWLRTGDSTVAFGPDGAVYIGVGGANRDTCERGLGVERSDDGGLTWSGPLYAQELVECDHFVDNESLTVDTFPASPHEGRLYLTYIRGFDFHPFAPIVMRYSDDRGETWSPMVVISGRIQGEGALPLVQPNGDLTVVYEDAIGPPFRLYAQTSNDGGATFTKPQVIARDEWREAHGMRTGFGIPAAAVDPVTAGIFVVWQDGRFRDPLNDILLIRSADGRHWGAPVRVNQDPEESRIDHLTPVVAAFAGEVHVTYFTRDDSGGYSRFLDERYIVSHDGGVTFGSETIVGDPIDLAYAATVFNLNGGVDRFLGDYNGIAAGPDGVHIVWCTASKPPHPETYHQTTWTATLVAH